MSCGRTIFALSPKLVRASAAAARVSAFLSLSARPRPITWMLANSANLPSERAEAVRTLASSSVCSRPARASTADLPSAPNWPIAEAMSRRTTGSVSVSRAWIKPGMTPGLAGPKTRRAMTAARRNLLSLCDLRIASHSRRVLPSTGSSCWALAEWQNARVSAKMAKSMIRGVRRTSPARRAWRVVGFMNASWIYLADSNCRNTYCKMPPC